MREYNVFREHTENIAKKKSKCNPETQTKTCMLFLRGKVENCSTAFIEHTKNFAKTKSKCNPETQTQNTANLHAVSKKQS